MADKQPMIRSTLEDIMIMKTETCECRPLADFGDIMELLQRCINTEDKTEASIDQDFLHDKKKCQIRLVGVMGRYKEKRRWIISEQDTRYENINVHGDDAHYTHTSQYYQKTLTSVQISKGHKFGIGAGLGGSGYGASVMVTPSYEYSWGKDLSTVQEKGESKTSSVDIIVRRGTAVVVKEVVYNVEKTGSSKFNFILRKDEKIPYLCNNESKTAKTKTLWETHLSKLTDSRFNWRESVEDGKPVLVCPFVADCCCFTTERSMETIKQVCDPERTQRILRNYLTYKNLDEQELQEKMKNETEEGDYNDEKREEITVPAINSSRCP